MLVVGDGMGIRSERRLCGEVSPQSGLIAAFCWLGLDGRVPITRRSLKNRHGAFARVMRCARLFESVVQRWHREGLGQRDGFAVDAELDRGRRQQAADRFPSRAAEAQEDQANRDPRRSGRSCRPRRRGVRRCLARDAEVHLAIRSARNGQARTRDTPSAYANNYLIDTDHGVIVDVEATRAIRQAEVGAARTMLSEPRRASA